ncbi:arsenosugar biosynthesis radical SAM (seleno)protein ArsS [Pseudanabaena sp. PCC 6802]|uniref:arsenosugar biosynthesis radical SAM (seleno)protein ArsS n=1 Tax=Pseudanabaena sp. PCC 6802 TaxID=118173 RepID=UPI00035EF4DF|nr:arsenosugar biosynthesis radical SAM (seleno)protein ArsS [Pseudanabaena sp. PCC 6802]
MHLQTVNNTTPFDQKLGVPLTKQKITVLQINLGRRCNITCNHCHVEASPKRTEELSPQICEQLITLIQKFPQIQTVDLTGGAPEMNYGFRAIAAAARALNKEVIVRSNLTIYFEDGYGDLPEYCAELQLRVVASLPCYLEDNVDKMRGKGVFHDSIRALQWLNRLGYGTNPNLVLDLVYNPPLPVSTKFSLAPNQSKLEQDYKAHLREHYGIDFNRLFAITNLPIGRTGLHLERLNLYQPYLEFLESNFNEQTVENLMCRNELSIDYLGNVYDCDFNQMVGLPARAGNGELLSISKLLELDNLDLISTVQTASYCYGCTAGSGSSCGGALL